MWIRDRLWKCSKKTIIWNNRMKFLIYLILIYKFWWVQRKKSKKKRDLYPLYHYKHSSILMNYSQYNKKINNQILYFVIEALIFVYKGYGLFYPPNTIGIEIFLLFAFAFNQFSRIFIGSMGNKTEVTSYILWYLLKI